MELEDIAGTARLLHKNWGLAVTDGLDWETLRQALQAKLKEMLTQEFEWLVQTMYRMDVFESKFQAALALPSVDERAEALSIIVLEREMLRLETWKKYSGKAE